MIHISKCHIVFVSIGHTNTLTLGYSRLDVLKFLWSICLSASNISSWDKSLLMLGC